MNSIDAKQPPKQFEDTLSWLLYDMMNEGCCGTYCYDGGKIGTIIIKVNKDNN